MHEPVSALEIYMLHIFCSDRLGSALPALALAQFKLDLFDYLLPIGCAGFFHGFGRRLKGAYVSASLKRKHPHNVIANTKKKMRR